MFPDGLPQNKELLYFYDKDCECDLLFWDILQKRVMLLIDRCYDGLDWCSEYSKKLYNAILPYTEFVVQFKTNIASSQRPRTRQLQLDTFRDYIVFGDHQTYAGYEWNPSFKIPRTEPLPDEFKSMFDFIRLGNETISVRIPATPPNQAPIEGSISYLVGFYRPFAYNCRDVYRQSFHRLKFRTKETAHMIVLQNKNHRRLYPSQQVSVAYEEVAVTRIYESPTYQEKTEYEDYPQYTADVCAGSVVVDCENDGIKTQIESRFDDTLLYKNIDDTFAELYFSAYEENKKWYRYRTPRHRLGEGLIAYDWSVDPQGFLIYAYPLAENLKPYQISQNIVTGDPLFIPLFQYSVVPLYLDDAGVYYTEQSETYLGYKDGAFSFDKLPNDLVIFSRSSSATVGNPNDGNHVWAYNTNFFSIGIVWISNDNLITGSEYAACIGLGSSEGSTFLEAYVLGEKIEHGTLKPDAEPSGQNVYGQYYDDDQWEKETLTYKNIKEIRKDYNTRYNSCPKKDVWKQFNNGVAMTENGDAMVYKMIDYMAGSYTVDSDIEPYFTQETEDLYLGIEPPRKYPIAVKHSRPDGYDLYTRWMRTEKAQYYYVYLQTIKKNIYDIYEDLYGTINLEANPEKNFASNYGVRLILYKYTNQFTGNSNPPMDIEYDAPDIHVYLWSIFVTIVEQIAEIHACLGADEFATYDDGGTKQKYYMNIARKLDWFAKAYGVAFNPDGSIMPLRQRVNVPYDKSNVVKIPDGWARGQFADNEGGGTAGQTGGSKGEERLGIAYQNRCNQYEKFDDKDPKNNVMKRGDVVLCENFLQLYESYLEDLDKGLNWQEMGTGMLPSADGSSVCTFEGIGTLLAEVAYMLSTLSSNIYQTHTLALKNYSTTLEVLKGMGLPIELGILPIDLGEEDAVSGTVSAYLNVPKIAEEAVTLHKRMMDIITNLAIINGSILEPYEDSTPTPPPTP